MNSQIKKNKKCHFSLFEGISLTVLNESATTKKKICRQYRYIFMSNSLRKVIMNRSKLKNKKYNQNRPDHGVN